ncbi:MAG: outer membrane lipoprotein carrier protein LolA [Prevotellaceae bacterium]|jgi:hypothetical protein|nr:outer membrane lipoprotein carrier protein LolA [Prevotellaceae bacterium]
MIAKKICSFFTIVAWVAPIWAQTNSTQVLERFRGKMEESPAAEMHFTLSGVDANGTSITSFEGVVYRQGADYAMLNPLLEVYVLGNTKWLYMAEINEAIVMNHDPTSLDFVENPLALFSAQLSKAYKVSGNPVLLKMGGQEVTEISLTPTDKNAPYRFVVLRIKSQTYSPHSIKYDAKDGSWFEAVITNWVPKTSLFPQERFTFPQKDHPGVYVTDMR